MLFVLSQREREIERETGNSTKLKSAGISEPIRNGGKVSV